MHCILNKAGRQRENTEDKRARGKPKEDDKKKEKPASHRLCGAEIPALSFLADEQAGSHKG